MINENRMGGQTKGGEKQVQGHLINNMKPNMDLDRENRNNNNADTGNKLRNQ